MENTLWQEVQYIDAFTPGGASEETRRIGIRQFKYDYNLIRFIHYLTMCCIKINQDTAFSFAISYV